MPCFDEGDHHAVLAVWGADHIYGEVFGREGDGVVRGDHGGHIFAALFGFVEDVEFSAVSEGGVGDGHLGGLSVGGLPLLVMAVGERNVVSGKHGVALLVLTLHRFHMHASICRHPTRHHEIHCGAVFGYAAALLLVRGQRDTVLCHHAVIQSCDEQENGPQCGNDSLCRCLQTPPDGRSYLFCQKTINVHISICFYPILITYIQIFDYQLFSGSQNYPNITDAAKVQIFLLICTWLFF